MDQTGQAARAAATGSGAVLAVACVSTLVVNANTSAVSILLPSISEDTGTSIDVLQYAVTGYSMVGAAVIVTSGALGDMFGRRRLFLAGLGLFVVSCVLIALSQDGAGVIVGRCIQGAAGSTILACGLSLLSVATAGKEQMRAVTLWGAASAVGAAAGPLVGGVLVGIVGWQALFWVDAAVAALCVPITLRSVQESHDPNRSHDIDYLGTVLIAGLLVPLVLALSSGSDWGWTSAATLGCLLLSVVCAVGFAVVEQRVAAPLVDMKLLKNKVLIGATVAILVVAGTLNGLMFVVSIYFQNPDTLDFSALEAGVATLPATVGLVLVTPLVTRAAARFGSGPTVAGGFVIAALGFGWLAFVDDSWKYAAFVLPFLVLAAGMAFSNGPASSVATACVSPEEVGAASGISNMARYVGAAIGVAATATVYSSVSDHAVDEGKAPASALASGFAATSLMQVFFCVAGLVIAAANGRHRPRAPRSVDDAVAAAATMHTVDPRPLAGAEKG